LRMKAVERAAKILPLAQDGDPRKPGLEAVQDQLLVKRPVVIFRNAPFVVVIRLIERIVPRPGAGLLLFHFRFFAFRFAVALVLLAAGFLAAASFAAGFAIATTTASILLPSRSRQNAP